MHHSVRSNELFAGAAVVSCSDNDLYELHGRAIPRGTSGHAGSPCGIFQELIDEIRIYNRALSVAEITAEMTTPVVSSTTKLE